MKSWQFPRGECREATRHRRSQWKASVPALVTCANPACREKHLPHVACPSCGQYGLAGLVDRFSRPDPVRGDCHSPTCWRTPERARDEC